MSRYFIIQGRTNDTLHVGKGSWPGSSPGRSIASDASSFSGELVERDTHEHEPLSCHLGLERSQVISLGFSKPMAVFSDRTSLSPLERCSVAPMARLEGDHQYSFIHHGYRCSRDCSAVRYQLRS